jgi:hypothetical protein
MVGDWDTKIEGNVSVNGVNVGLLITSGLAVVGERWVDMGEIPRGAGVKVVLGVAIADDIGVASFTVFLAGEHEGSIQTTSNSNARIFFFIIVTKSGFRYDGLEPGVRSWKIIEKGYIGVSY